MATIEIERRVHHKLLKEKFSSYINENGETDFWKIGRDDLVDFYNKYIGPFEGGYSISIYENQDQMWLFDYDGEEMTTLTLDELRDFLKYHFSEE